MDKRHAARIKTVQDIFSSTFTQIPIKDMSPKARLILEHKQELDSMIEEAAPRFPVAKIALVDLSILRLSMYELMYEQKTPAKVVINEAVELAKELGGDRSPAFVNAVLGYIFTHKLSHDE